MFSDLVFRLYDMLTVGALSKGSILALGLMPYATARIYVRLATAVSPRFAKWLTRGATRALTVGLSLVQAYGYARFTQSTPGAIVQTTITLTAGAVFAMWLCEQVTAEDEVHVPKVKRSELPEISGGYDAMYAQLRAARQKQAV